MRVIFGLQPKTQRGWYGALTTYWSRGERLYVELGATGTVWRARLGPQLKQPGTLETIYANIHDMKRQHTQEGTNPRFKVEVLTALVGDLFSAATYQSPSFYGNPDVLPALLASPNRSISGRGLVEYGDQLLQILHNLELRSDGKLAISVDMGYALPGLVLQSMWCSMATEITLVLSDDVGALDWIAEFITYEQPITILVVHNDRHVRAHLVELITEITGVKTGEGIRILSVPFMTDPIRFRNPTMVKKAPSEIVQIYELYRNERPALDDPTTDSSPEQKADNTDTPPQKRRFGR